MMRSRGGTNQEDDYSSPPKVPLHDSFEAWEESPNIKLKTDNSMIGLLSVSSSTDDEDEVYETNAQAENVSRRAVPGRATRQRRRRRRKMHSTSSRKGRKSPTSFWYRLYLRWMKPLCENSSQYSSLFIAVFLWYSLGVISISTSKLLLMKSKLPAGSIRYYHHVGAVSPMLLTLQQLLFGSTFLRFLLNIRFLDSPGIQPLASLVDTDSSKSVASSPSVTAMALHGGSSLRNRRRLAAYKDVTIIQTLILMVQHKKTRYLCLAGFCFSLGFYCTNVAFEAASAGFVETIKASEPITSAILAVSWGLEVLNNIEVTSLGTIVCGVILSTVGNHSPSSGQTSSVLDSLLSCIIVMVANLCFSFRGLYQKLFQSKSNHSILMDDLNLQYRMQQMGVMVFLLPTVLWSGPSAIQHIYKVFSTVGLFKSGVLVRYLMLSITNALAFASYK